MINRVNAGATLSLLMILGIAVNAQIPKPTPQHANPKFGEGDFLIKSLIFESSAGRIGVAITQPPGVVKSLNGKTGDLTLEAGANITITPSGNTLTISAPTALSGVAHDATLTGSGTTLSPLSVVSAGSLRQPFYDSGQGTTLGSIFQIPFSSVPAGKNLIIEHVSGFCELPVGQRVIDVQLIVSAGRFHMLLPLSTGTTLNPTKELYCVDPAADA